MQPLATNIFLLCNVESQVVVSKSAVNDDGDSPCFISLGNKKTISRWKMVQNIKEPPSLLGTLCASLISGGCVCAEEAGSWPSALKARGLDSRVLLELLIIPLPDPPNSS